MSEKIVSINCRDEYLKHDLNPDMVLENLKGELEGFIIMGYDKEGNEYLASTYVDKERCLWLAERLKRVVLMSADTDEP